jgi:hypothetical protein
LRAKIRIKNETTAKKLKKIKKKAKKIPQRGKVLFLETAFLSLGNGISRLWKRHLWG